MKIEKPGIFFGASAADYFADPCPTPSLTQSLAKILIEQSPLHAYQACPRLNVPTADEDDADKYDKAKAIGNAAHKLMLGRGKDLALADYDNWMKKEAKAFKAEAIAAGQEPILMKHFEAAQEMVMAAREQLLDIPECEDAFTRGEAEVVIANREPGTWLRSMIDWLSPDCRDVFDYKTTGQSVSPYVTGKLMASAGWHVQAAMHERILDALKPADAGRRRHLFVAQENEPPYSLTVNEISEAAMTIGRKQIEYAVTSWSICLARKKWPAYPLRIIRPELPGWKENAWLDRELAEESENNPSLVMAG